MDELFGYVPPVTKYICLSALATSTLCSLHFIGMQDLFFDTNLVLEKLEIWRVFTTFTYFGDFNIFTFLNLFMLFQNCKMLEVMIFQGAKAEFLNFILFSSSMLLLLAPFLNLLFLSESLLMCILYLLSKKNREGQFGFLFMPMLRIPSTFLPYVYLMLGMFSRSLVVGMSIGHLYYYFEEVLPKLPNFEGFRPLKPLSPVCWLAARIA
mmetsp:Transcript_8875/g.13231  ORF Transcript_8875/g.13231 Transcript_8875/m.13231 type:complete len:209 (+) Transcript_8875:35-661(+)